MNFIEHIIEPKRLLMTWQDHNERTRYTVAELCRQDDVITLRYLTDTADFQKAKRMGFDAYPAFQNVDEIYNEGVLNALMRRLPPRSRADYDDYLTGLRIKPGTALSDFALLAYSGARLPSDGFAIIHPFDKTETAFEFLLEAAGFRHVAQTEIKIGDEAHFQISLDLTQQEEAIKIFVGKQHVGYVTRALLPTFKRLMTAKRILSAHVEKCNGLPSQPALYLYVKIAANY